MIHGRPFPLKGNYFANVVIHFEPLGPINEAEKQETKTDNDTIVDIPPYIIPGSVLEDVWKSANPNGWKLVREIASVYAFQLLSNLNFPESIPS